MELREYIEKEPARRVGYRSPILIDPESSVGDAAARMREESVGCLLVGDLDELLGIFTERDLLRKVLSSKAEATFEDSILSVMTPKPVVIGASESIATLLRRMFDGGFRHIPMISDQGSCWGPSRSNGSSASSRISSVRRSTPSLRASTSTALLEKEPEMRCPYCRYDNIPGVDQCDSCGMGLAGLDIPTGSTEIEDKLISDPVESLSPNPAVMVTGDTSVAEVIELLVERNIGCVLVGTADKVEGIFTERDVLLKLSGAMSSLGQEPVRNFMTARPEMVECSLPLAFGLNQMHLGDYRHLPLTRDGKLEGIVSLRDFLGIVFRVYPDLGLSAT